MKVIYFVFLMAITNLAYATEVITWDTLRAEQQLSYQNISASDQALITEIYVYDLARKTRSLSPMEQNGYDQRVALAQRKGLNVRALLNERANKKKQENAIITELNYDDMKIAGFLVPLEMSGLTGTQFILVPTAGACIHTPPPPVNQTVLVNIPQGYELESLYTPVWVIGSIQAQSLQQSIALSDGNQTVETGYEINASEIRVYQ